MSVSVSSSSDKLDWVQLPLVCLLLRLVWLLSHGFVDGTSCLAGNCRVMLLSTPHSTYRIFNKTSRPFSPFPHHIFAVASGGGFVLSDSSVEETSLILCELLYQLSWTCQGVKPRRDSQSACQASWQHDGNPPSE